MMLDSDNRKNKITTIIIITYIINKYICTYINTHTHIDIHGISNKKQIK